MNFVSIDFSKILIVSYKSETAGYQYEFMLLLCI